MALTNSQYDTIIRTYEERQTRERRRLDERIHYVNSHVKGYKELEEQLASLSVQHARRLLDGDESALPQLKTELGILRKKQAELLANAGLGKDYLNPVFVCETCQDTGYIGNKKCHCFKQQMIDLLYEQSNMKELLEKQNFSRLSYAYYEGEDLFRFQKAVETCQNFIRTFNSDYHNLFFYGTVGTGKSFLSGCVAKELIENGHSVIYFSAAGLFDTLSKFKFDYKNADELHKEYEDLFQCDLLIIDDLGTEYTNNLVNSELFSLINDRHLRQKATIISTNLSLEDFRNRYSDRIFSRITSNYEICKITGPDIRMFKKRQQNRK